MVQMIGKSVLNHSLLTPSWCQGVHNEVTIFDKENAAKFGCEMALLSLFDSNSLILLFIGKIINMVKAYKWIKYTGFC